MLFLIDGYGFHRDDTLTVIDQINGNKVGWALGAILYEINELPWVLQLSTLESHPYSFVLLAAVAGFFLGVVAAVFVYREVLADKFHYTSEANYQHANSTSAKAHYLYHRYHQLSMDEGDDDDEEQADGGHPRRERERSHSSSFFNSFFGFPDESPVPQRSSKHGAANHKSTLSRNGNSGSSHSASNLMSYYNNYYNKKYHISTPPTSVGDQSEKVGSLTGTLSGMQSPQSLNSPNNKTPFYNVTLVKEVPLDISSDSNKADHAEYEAHKPSNLHININYQTPPPAGPPDSSTNTALSPESNASPLLQQNAHGRPLSQVGSSQFNHSYSIFTPVARGQGWLDWVDLKPNARPMDNIASPPANLGGGGGNIYANYRTAGSSENVSMAEGMLATNSSDSSQPPSVKDRGKHRQQQKKW